MIATSPPASEAVGVPAESLGRLFLRFLHFGVLAWGGPFAQIAMLRQTFVEDERWVSSEHFNRVLALYQVLPGPEAHEMCVYFGMLCRGRAGGILAGLGFMLPGFILMFALSWLYVRFGFGADGSLGLVFAFVQAAVAALVVRAVHRIGSHVLLDPWLWTIALLSLVAQLLGVHFAITLGAGGVLYVLARHHAAAAVAAFAVVCVLVLGWAYLSDFQLQFLAPAEAPGAAAAAPAGLLQLFVSGLKAGLLTFGGAYTAIPLLQKDAVVDGGWMSNTQFLDGLALSGLLPAPLIIFSTFVGYIGAGPLGALLMTIGVFAPAFAFTLIAHDPLERLVHRPQIRTFLSGLVAAVVGLIAGTAVTLLVESLSSVQVAAMFAAALFALFFWNNRMIIPLTIAAAAGLGYAASMFQ
jgi:chromate transporter